MNNGLVLRPNYGRPVFIQYIFERHIFWHFFRSGMGLQYLALSCLDACSNLLGYSYARVDT